MRVFIMWAGEQSHSVAQALKEFLEFVVRGPRYFISDDIEGGRLWRMVIAGELETASFGIACLTRDNLLSHWLHFEAGALSKAVGQANVIPFLVGPSTTDLDGPLADFQILDSNESGVRKLVSLIAAGVPDTNREIVEKSFGFVWNEFVAKLENVRAARPPERPEPVRDEIALIREILERVRRLENRGESLAESTKRSTDSLPLSEQALDTLKRDVLSVLDGIDMRATSMAMEYAITNFRTRLGRADVTLEDIVDILRQARLMEGSLDR